MDFDSARKQFERLTRLFHNGDITSEEYTQGVDQLAIKDEQGNEWMIGMQSGRWYRKEGENWAEDDPHAKAAVIEPSPTGGEKRSLRLLWLLLLLAVVLACTGYWYFGLSGRFPKQGGAMQQTEESEIQTQVALLEMQASQTMDAAAGTSEVGEGMKTTTPQVSLTPTLSDEQLTATATTPTATPIPTATATPLPPEPAAPPESWRPQSVLDLGEELALTQDWAKVPEKNWEYEFLTYEDQQALLIQFTDPEVLFHAAGAEFNDVERQTTLALPDIEGGVSMVCRWDEAARSGYALRLTNQTWELLLVEAGSETVLNGGTQSSAFQQGDYETFVLRCQSDRLEVYREGVQLVNEVDTTLETGAAGLRFEINEGIGLAFFTQDRVLAQLAEDIVAGEGDVVRLANLDIQFVQVNVDYDQMEESEYLNQDLIGIGLRIDNKTGADLVVGADTFLLTDGRIQNEGLDFVPQSAGNRPLLPFILPPGVSTGEIFFTGVSPDDLADWILIVDLRYEGLGEAVFTLATEE